MQKKKKKHIMLFLNEYNINDRSDEKKEVTHLLIKYEKEHLINIESKKNGRFLNIKNEFEEWINKNERLI